MKFYDRKQESDLLMQSLEQSRSSATFTVVMGRRRIGKTWLISHVLEQQPYGYFFVSRDSEAVLCQRFQTVMSEQLGISVYGKLTNMRDVMEALLSESVARNFSVVFDEFQNFLYVNPSIFSTIQELWDRYQSSSKMNLIVCGSIFTMMKCIFEDRSEPLYGRPTSRFTLRRFRIAVIKEILHDYNPDYTSEDLLCLYTLTGGVAKYIALLMDAGATTKRTMLNYVARQDSYFLSEGKALISEEFGKDYASYFSILQLVAGGMTRQSEIDGMMGKNTGTYLDNLEKRYAIISKQQPILAKPGSRNMRYGIDDCFLRFWFRFIYPNQQYIETERFDLLLRAIQDGYEQFSGKALELYFCQKLGEEEVVSNIGGWWDTKGMNEIDLIALNDFDGTAQAIEVKRNARKLSAAALASKVAALPSAFGKYAITTRLLSMDDM